MKLIIDKLAWNTFSASTEDVMQIHSIIRTLLKQNVIKTNDKVIDKTIEFSEMSTRIKNKLFLSSIKNKIPLSKGDPIIKEKGRDFLETEKLTKEQWFALKDSLFGVMDRLQINADIYLLDDNKKVYWRKGKQNVSWMEEPKSFPVKP